MNAKQYDLTVEAFSRRKFLRTGSAVPAASALAGVTALHGQERASTQAAEHDHSSSDPPSIQGLDPDGTEFLLVFNQGLFSEDGTMLLSPTTPTWSSWRCSPRTSWRMSRSMNGSDVPRRKSFKRTWASIRRAWSRFLERSWKSCSLKAQSR